jgi:hypothetical protein
VPSITVIFFTCVRPLIDAPAKPQNYTSLTDAIGPHRDHRYLRR